MSDMSWALPWNWGPAGQQYGAQGMLDANLAQNQAAQAANAAAVQQASQAASAPGGYNNVYNSPVAFGDYSYGRVGGYPSFGEASGGGSGGGDPNATPYDQYGPSWDGGGGGGGGNDLYFDGVSFVRRSATGGTNYDEPFSGRFGGAEQPQLPSQITDGGYPSFDSRWNQIADPYYNTPLNNALWQRGDNAGPQMPPQYQPPPPQSTGGDDLYFDGVSFVRRSATGGATGYQRDELAQQMLGVPSRPTANQGYNPGFGGDFATGGAGGFQNRFGMGYPGQGTPSQYTPQPYTNTQGQTYQPNMPPGFTPPFSVDTPQGITMPSYELYSHPGGG